MINKYLQPYDPKEAEEKIYDTWEKSGFFNPNNLPGERKETFSMVLPPPNVTGKLHLGHADMLAIEDTVVRFQRMLGKKTLWLPGTDHAAIATQTKVEKILAKEKQLDELIFDSGLRYSASLHNLNNEEYIVYTMGSPESILNLCSFTDLNGEPKSILSTEMKRLKERYSLLAAQGFRLIAMAYKVIPKDRSLNISFEETNIESKKILREAVFAGFVTLHDPIRRGVKEAVRTCKKAGMNPIIITGDHKLTAKAIAQELELNAKEDNILEGDDLDKMSDDAFNEVFEKIKIYARVEPRHKIRIVEAWQRKGEIVAMTGDGINDAPALKKANIGVALGSGTDVAKEASDLILLDDNFEVIVVAVEEGRRIIDNIRKVLTYLLMGSFTEIILIGTALFFRLPLPVLPGQILWKNVIEDTPPSFALTLEPKEKDIMNRPPEPPNLSLLTKQMKFLILAVGILTDLVLVGIFAWFLNQTLLEKVNRHLEMIQWYYSSIILFHFLWW